MLKKPKLPSLRPHNHQKRVTLNQQWISLCLSPRRRGFKVFGLQPLFEYDQYHYAFVREDRESEVTVYSEDKSI